MNTYTKLIAEFLNIDMTRAWQVQEEMMCMGISFSNSSKRQLKVAAQEALNFLESK